MKSFLKGRHGKFMGPLQLDSVDREILLYPGGTFTFKIFNFYFGKCAHERSNAACSSRPVKNSKYGSLAGSPGNGGHSRRLTRVHFFTITAAGRAGSRSKKKNVPD